MLKLRYINEYRDRAGNVRRYFRRGAVRKSLPGEVGSAEFMAAYQALLGEQPAQTAKIAGSLGLLITEFYAKGMRNLKPSSKVTYRAALEPIAKAHGHRTADITHRQAAKLVSDLADKPAMANLTKRVLHALYKYAAKNGWVAANPVTGVERYKTGTHHTWTEGELKTFEARWPLGTRQRLAYELLLQTAQRVGDVARMTRGDIVGGELHVIQQKTGTELHLPIRIQLERAMRACPARGLSLIGRTDGRPMTRAGLSRLMTAAIKQACLPAKCVSHGLRKAALRRLAEDGATGKQIAAWSGHKSLGEIERYTAAADQRRLASAAPGRKENNE